MEELNNINKTDFFSLFNDNQFAHQRDWKTCFCRFYHTDCTYEEWMKRTGMDNRLEAEEEILSGNMGGLLAYDGDLCVGWLNVGPILRYKRLIADIEPNLLNSKTALSICFVIRESHRGKGIASKLLDEAISLFRNKGYERMIALPRDSATRERNYRGFSQMYLNRGYMEHVDQAGTHYLILKF